MYLTRNRARALKNITNEEEGKEENYCLICWEPQCPNQQNNIYKMKEIKLFKYICKCNCKFHLVCFFDWATKTKACPICREKLSVNNELLEKYRGFLVVNNNDNDNNDNRIVVLLRNTWIVSRKITETIFKYITILFLMYISIKVIAFIISKF